MTTAILRGKGDLNLHFYTFQNAAQVTIGDEESLAIY
jgi:hypothetical protein